MMTKITKRKFRLLTATVLAVFIALTAIAALAGCTGEEYQATSIEWLISPKTLYYVGEEFDPQDAAIRVTYDNDPERVEILALKDIPDGYTLENFSTETRAFDLAVTLNYKELTLSFLVDVITEEDLKTVKFYPENGQKAEDGTEYFFSEQVVAGKTVNKPADPEKEGLYLKEWTTADGTAFNFAAAVRSDLELHAVWFAEYQFYNENRIVNTVRVTEGEAFPESELPALSGKQNYSVAWRYNDSGFTLGELNPREMRELPLAETYFGAAERSLRFDAVYIPDTYTVTVDVMGGQINEDEFDADESGKKNTVFVPYGYSIAQGMTLFGKDFKVLNDVNVTKETENGLYSFAGWYTMDENGGFDQKIDVSETPISADTKICARWQYGTVFYLASVNTAGSVPAVDNVYDILKPTIVMTDEGKAISDREIPIRSADEYLGFNRWWSGTEPGNHPEQIDDFAGMASVDEITSTIGTPNKRPTYYETFYKIRYTFEFVLGNGQALNGVKTEVTGLWYGAGLKFEQVLKETQVDYNADGVRLRFYKWYLDEARNEEFDYLVHKIDKENATTTVENGVTAGRMRVYADYYAVINWSDPNPTGASSGTLDPSVTRLSRNNVTRANLPNLKVVPNYDRDWYVDGDVQSPAFDRDSGKLKILTESELKAVDTKKAYDVAFRALDSDGNAFDFEIATQRVNTDESIYLPYEFRRYDADTDSEIAGYRVGDRELEGYYKDAAFTVRYSFKKITENGETVWVSEETFAGAATVYARFTRIATEGMKFETYSSGKDYYVQSAEGLENLKEIVIAETYKGKPVVGIDNNAFENFKALESVFAPATIKEIRAAAFKNCEKLLNLPKTAKDVKLGEEVYNGTAWYLAEWEKSYAKQGGYILLGDLNAEDTLLYEYRGTGEYGVFAVPEGVEILGTKAFSNANDKLEGVTLPTSLRIIREKAFYMVSGSTSNGFTSIYAEGANLEIIESGAFYRLPNLTTLTFEGQKFKSFDNVLYEMENGEKNSLIVYPSAREAETFADADGREKTYYIIDESVASIRENAFSACSLDAVVFRRGRNIAISATTLPAYFLSQFQSTTVFYVPYRMNAENVPEIASFYGGWAEEFGARIVPDAFEINFRSPEADGLQESGWTPAPIYLGFADAITAYIPENAETLELAGLYLEYADGAFSKKIEVGSPVYFAVTVYESWIARMNFIGRDGSVVTVAAPLGTTVEDALKAQGLTADSIAIPPAEGKNSEWTGRFRSFETGKSEEPEAMYFGAMTDKKARYGGNYTIYDTDIAYRVSLKDPYFDENYGEFTVTYGKTVDSAAIAAPTRDGLIFVGFYLTAKADDAGRPDFIKLLTYDENGSVFNEEFLQGFTGAREEDGTIPVTFYARWQVQVAFYHVDITADGKETPKVEPSFRISVDYGGEITADARETPHEYEGYRSVWAAYENGVYAKDLSDDDFKNLKESFSVYAHYIRMTLKVTFRAEGSADVTVDGVKYGEAIAAAALPANPTPPRGMKFDDWYSDEAFTERFDPNAAVYEDTTVYAHFAAVPNGADLYVDGSANSAGLKYELIDPAKEDGLKEFRLAEVTGYQDKVLNLPNEIRGIGRDGEETVLGKLTEIQSGAFSGNDRIEHVILGESLKNIATGAFRNMPSLRKITADAANNSYTSVDGVLYRKSTPTLIKYPSAKEGDAFRFPEEFKGAAFGAYAFENPVNLRRIVIEGAKPTLYDNAFVGIDWSTFKIYVDSDRLNSYKSDAQWKALVSETYIDTVFQSSTVTVTFRNTLTGEDFKVVKNIPLYGSVSDPGAIGNTDAYHFDGWCVDKEGKTKYEFGRELFDSITLYARFIRSGSTAGLKFVPVTSAGGEVAGYAVSIGSASAKKIVIPNFYNSAPVIKITENGFLNADITSIEIPYSVKEIGSGAFVGLKALERITIDELNGKLPSEYFAVADNVLYNKDRTEIVLYPAADRSRTEFIAPNTLEKIGEYAFYGNLSLTSVTLPQSIRWISGSAFAKSALLKLSIDGTERVYLEDSNAFIDLAADFSIFVRRELYDEYRAEGTSWTNVKSKIYPFTAVIRYYFGADETEAFAVSEEYETFRNVSEPRYADDDALSRIITDPPEGKAFRYWTVKGTGEVWSFTEMQIRRDLELVANWIDRTAESYFTDAAPDNQNYAVLMLSETAGKDWTRIVIPSVYNGKPVRQIYQRGFTGLYNLTEVVLPASLVSIGKEAFKDATNLKTISFPESLQSIGESAFENCASLLSVRLPSNLTQIPKAAFKNCTMLTDFDFGASNVTTIGEEAFYNCENLLSPAFPKNLTSIGASAYYGAASVVRVNFPEKLKTLGEKAFYGASKLLEAKFLGNAATSIGASAFEGCGALTDVRLPEGLNAITANLFYGARSLVEIAIPDSVKVIEDGAFRYCSSLASVKFGTGLTNVGSYAFAGTTLVKIELPESLVNIGNFAFGENANLRKVYVKGVPSNVGEKVFGEGAELSIFAETEEVYDAYLRFGTIESQYKNKVMKRYVKVTFRYVGANGADETWVMDTESDKTIEAPDTEKLPNFSNPEGGKDYSYREGFWYATREIDKVKTDVEWNFASNTVREDTELIMRYILSPVKEGENSDGLKYRKVSGDRWEVVGVGSLSNKTTIVIPNYYQSSPVVSIASGFLTGFKATNAVIVIPETVEKIAEDAFRSANLERFVLIGGDANPRFRVEDDALFEIVSNSEASAPQAKLLRYPSTLSGKDGIYTLDAPRFKVDGDAPDLDFIGEYAFEYNRFNAFTVSAGLKFHAADDVLYEGAAGSESQAMIAYPNRKALLNENGVFTLPSEVKTIYKSALSLTSDSEIRKFAVQEGNLSYFADEAGVLYKAGDDGLGGTVATLVRMPAKFASDTGSYVAGGGLMYGGSPITLASIAAGAFANVAGLTTIVFSIAEGEEVPNLESVTAFENCAAYFLADNARYDDFKAKANWGDVALYKRYSYITYVTDDAIPNDLAAKFLPENYTASGDGFVKEVQTITSVKELSQVVDGELQGLLRIPYSEIEGWYYDAAFAERVNFNGGGALVKNDMTLYAKWVVSSKASRPQSTESGEGNEYFGFYPVTENGSTVSYEVSFLMASGITELKEIVIPSYYSPDGTEKNRLPVTGFYDDGTDNTKYTGFSKLETLVIPETFRTFRNIFRTKGDGIVAPRNLTRLVILSKETNYLKPEHVLTTTTQELSDMIGAIGNSNFSYYFHDYTTYSAYRQNTVWGGSAGMRGKLLTTIVELQIPDPETGELRLNPYIRYQSGVETLSSYEKFADYTMPYGGYEIDRWEIYRYDEKTGELVDTGEIADPDVTTFGGVARPLPTELYDRVVLKAVYRKIAESE